MGGTYEGFLSAVESIGLTTTDETTFSKGAYSNKLMDKFLVSAFNP